MGQVRSQKMFEIKHHILVRRLISWLDVMRPKFENDKWANVLNNLQILLDQQCNSNKCLRTFCEPRMKPGISFPVKGLIRKTASLVLTCLMVQKKDWKSYLRSLFHPIAQGDSSSHLISLVDNQSVAYIKGQISEWLYTHMLPCRKHIQSDIFVMKYEKIRYWIILSKYIKNNVNA